ncbi:MAG: divalent metal cation transporter [Chloroflexi bacterium]|nr:divalent metal cation transporter [Chloroflexota bacterium]
MNTVSKAYLGGSRVMKFLKLLAVISGPGILVMVADNDAGGITTYTATGAKFGYGLIWFLVLLGPIAYFVQEMTVRLGAVTKRGHAEAIFDAFGSFWGWFSFFDLSLTNWLTLVSEFIGMTAGLRIFGIPGWLTVTIVVVFMGAMILQGSYWTWEKIALVFCLINIIYVPAAFLVNPPWETVIRTGIIPHLPGGLTGTMIFFLMANVGTTIAPWMVFFQQSAVVDKGLKQKDILWGQIDTAVGSFLTVVVAIFCVVVTGATLPGVNIQSAAEAALALMPINHFAGAMMAIGLFDAGLLGAICISLSSSWAIGEVFGWAHSLNNKVREAPWFYAYYFFLLISAGILVLIPGAPLVTMTLFVQVVATTLLPAALVFLILLLNNEELMGKKYKNTTLQNVINFAIVISLIVLSTGYSLTTLFPNLFGQ